MMIEQDFRKQTEMAVFATAFEKAEQHETKQEWGAPVKPVFIIQLGNKIE